MSVNESEGPSAEGPLRAVAAVAEDMQRILDRLDAGFNAKYVSKWPEGFNPRAPYLITHEHGKNDEVLLGYLARAGIVHRFTTRGVGTIWQRTGQ